MAGFAANAGRRFWTLTRGRSRRTAAGALALLLAAGAVAAVQAGHDPRPWAEARDEGPGRPPEGASEALGSMSHDGCGWQPEFLAPNLSAYVWAMTVYDDGTGPALYVGGSFTIASGVIVNHVARWDGTAWSALDGPSGTGTDGPVYALAVLDDGNGPALYAGGDFTTAGGVTVNNIARWDGSAWSALSGPSGTGVIDSVYALAGFDDGTGPALYAGGRFTIAGGVTVNRVARWDGSAWSALSGPSGTGVTNTVRALAAFDDGTGPMLYAGGWFVTAAGVTVNHIARWDGSAWSALSGPSGTGANGTVHALAVFDDGAGPALYAGGEFTFAGGVAVAHVARWDGSAWSALSGPSGTGTYGTVYALSALDDGTGHALYAAGEFNTAGGVTVNNVARWDGSVWSALSGPSGIGIDGRANALAVFDDGTGPALHAGGYFRTAGGVVVEYVAHWDGTVWSALSPPSGTAVDGWVSALAVHDDGTGPALYSGGWFITAGGLRVEHVARWDGSAWSALTGPLGTGADHQVRALAVFDDGTGPALYAGGSFITAGGVTVNGIARWDGGAWSALSGPSGTGVSSAVSALAVFDDGAGPALYAGGSFITAGGVTVHGVARWDGVAWSALSGPSGTGVEGSVFALTVFDDGTGRALYAGGYLTSAGGVTAHGVARWDGSAWSALNGPSGTGVSGTVNALVVYDDGTGPALYAGGDFTNAGGVTVNRVARWDGSAWSALSGPSGTGVGGDVHALAVFNDGSWPALYAGGRFMIAGGLRVNNVARWSGSTWTPLSGPSETGVNDFVTALAEFDDGTGPALYAGGDFTIAGGLASSYLASWRCGAVFADGFESRTTTRWSLTQP